MPVSECPQCFRELEVDRPTGVANKHLDCPVCGGGVSGPISELGPNTGTYLWPSAEPFRDGSSFVPSRRAEVAKATIEEPVAADDRFEGQPTGVAVEASRAVDSQPSGRRIWSIHKWGIASLLRHFRKNSDVEPAEKMPYPELAACTMTAEDGLREVMPAMSTEDSLHPAPWTDQRIGYPGVRHRPEEGIAEPAEMTESVILLPDEPVVLSDKPWWPASYVMQWPEEEPQSAVIAQLHVRASDQQARTASRLFSPRSYFWWFMFVAVVEALTVVPLVWILGATLA